MIDKIARTGPVTRLQYGLMIVLGTLCLLAALAPVAYELKVAAVSMTFGMTVGLWVSHLIDVVYRPSPGVAVDE